MSWTDLITKIFDRTFADRWSGGCSGWTHELVIAHFIADVLIWLAYMTIPVFLIKLARDRKDIPFNFVFFLFALFIIGCGFTHLVGAITPFYPYYYLDFWVKAVTMLASIGTAMVLWKLYPRVASLPSPFTLNKELEERVLARTSELEKVNKHLENFALIAAHDLQDPLKQNSVFFKLVQEGKTEFLEEIVKNNARMDSFVKSLLNFARSGGTNLKIEKASVKKIISTVLKELDFKVKATSTQFDIGEMPVLNCNVIQLGRVFQNLFANAMKNPFPDRPLVIKVSAKQQGDSWLFVVSDNGAGMTPDQMNSLFTIYQGKKNDSTGAGFGLAICKRIVESHNGEIQAESVKDAGSKFIFTIGKNEND